MWLVIIHLHPACEGPKLARGKIIDFRVLETGEMHASLTTHLAALCVGPCRWSVRLLMARKLEAHTEQALPMPLDGQGHTATSSQDAYKAPSGRTGPRSETVVDIVKPSQL